MDLTSSRGKVTYNILNKLLGIMSDKDLQKSTTRQIKLKKYIFRFSKNDPTKSVKKCKQNK